MMKPGGVKSWGRRRRRGGSVVVPGGVADSIWWDFRNASSLTVAEPPDDDQVTAVTSVYGSEPLSTPSGNPLVNANGVEFSGAAEGLRSDRPLSYWKGLHAAAGSYIGLVFRIDNTSAFRCIFDTTGSASGSGHGVSFFRNTSVFSVVVANGVTGAVSVFRGSFASAGVWAFVRLVHDAAGYRVLYHGDTELTGSISVDGHSIGDAAQEPHFGVLGNGVSFPHLGLIAGGVIVPNRRPSPSEVTALDSFILSQYGSLLT